MLFLISLLLQSIPTFREAVHPKTHENITSDSVHDFFTSHRVVSWLQITDLILLSILTMIAIFWFCVCPNKKEFYCDPLRVISLVVLFYQWFPVTMMVSYTTHPDWYRPISAAASGAKVSRVFLLLILLCPLRSMKILGKALADSWKELGLLMLLLVMSSITFGYLIFVVELTNDDTHFRSIPDGLWWGVVTLTTVGYGDLYPQSVWGRLVGVVCGVVGILVIALPVPIIAGNFTKIYDLVAVGEYHWNEKQAAKKREKKMAMNRSKEQLCQITEKPNMILHSDGGVQHTESEEPCEFQSNTHDLGSCNNLIK